MLSNSLSPGRIASVLLMITCALVAAALYVQSTHETAEAAAGTNGRLPQDALSEIEPGFLLVHGAADAYGELIDALEAAGHTATLNSAYRSLDEQQRLIDTLGLLDDGGLAAPLGTSEHGDGIAVDLSLDWDALMWMRANAHEFGFAETVNDEPWHWAYVRR